jgi:hypothetical protein
MQQKSRASREPPVTPAPERWDRVRRRLVLALVAACTLAPFPYFERLNNPNENVRLYMTMAMVEDGTFAIDGPTRRFGWVNDRAARNGRLYAGKAPGASLAGAPIYALGAWVAGGPLSRPAAVRLLRLAAVSLPCLLFLVAFRRFLDGVDASPWLRDAALVGYGVGSMAYAYGMMFVGHQLAAACLFGAVIAFHTPAHAHAHASHGGGWWRAAIGGALLGAAPAMEYPAALGAIAVAVYAALALRRPALLAVAAGCALGPVALVLCFHASAFGSPLAFPYDFIENPAFQRLLAEGWHGATFPPRLDRLAAMLVSPSFGLLFFTPLLLLAPAGWVVAARAGAGAGGRAIPPHRRHLAWLLPAVPMLILLYLASSALWRAGWSVGPRYAAAAVPFLVVSALLGAGALERRWPRAAAAAFAVLTVLAVLHSGTSGALYPHQPEAFDNPVYDLNPRLAGLGFAPHTALEPLGVTGAGALVALALLLAATLVPVVLGPWRRPGAAAGHALVVAASAALVALALARLGGPSEAEDRAWDVVVRTWEPVRAVDVAR